LLTRYKKNIQTDIKYNVSKRLS